MLPGAMYPLVASLFRRPRLSTVWRQRWKSSPQPSLVRPAGSQKPTESCPPSSDSGARSGEPAFGAPSTLAEPVRPA